jgi:Chaperone of endosialidase
MSGVAGESDHTYIRNVNTTTVSGGSADFVTVDVTTGLLGHLGSSRRYKEEIKSMDNASQALFALKPVTFRYKKDIDQSQSLDYGLIAEDVAQVDPNLAIRDRNGQIESVRYSAINAMLLNEFLKEHRKNEEQEATIARQQKQIDALAEGLQKVSAQLEVSKPATRTVNNNQ